MNIRNLAVDNFNRSLLMLREVGVLDQIDVKAIADEFAKRIRK